MAKKIYPYELIGQEIEITNSKNKSNIGLKGKIVDETKYTIKIIKIPHRFLGCPRRESSQSVIQKGKTKTLMKNNITFKLKKTNKTIEGKTIVKRPEERIKGK